MDGKNPIVIILIVAVVMVGLYYLISPYQNCVRKNSHRIQPYPSYKTKGHYCGNRSW